MTASRVPAGLRVRALAFWFDYLVIAAYLTVLVLAGVTLNARAPELAARLFGGAVVGQATGFALVTLPVLLYFALSEASLQRATWGKRRMRLEVSDAAGSRLGIGRSLARTALKFVPWELAHTCVWQIRFADDPAAPAYTLGFVAVWILVAVNLVSIGVHPLARGWYDRIAGARVQRRAEQAQLPGGGT